MSEPTIDHDEIRRWAESKGGKPAAVERTHEDGGDVGIIRIMFPDNPNSHHDSLVEISWDEFFQQFDEAELALVYSENSLFNKLVGRDTLEKREHGDSHAARHADRDPGGNSKSHAPAKSSSSGSAGKNGSRDSSDADDLKSREYRGEDGQIHHHTHAYMEKHGQD